MVEVIEEDERKDNKDGLGKREDEKVGKEVIEEEEDDRGGIKDGVDRCGIEVTTRGIEALV